MSEKLLLALVADMILARPGSSHYLPRALGGGPSSEAIDLRRLKRALARARTHASFAEKVFAKAGEWIEAEPAPRLEWEREPSLECYAFVARVVLACANEIRSECFPTREKEAELLTAIQKRAARNIRSRSDYLRADDVVNEVVKRVWSWVPSAEPVIDKTYFSAVPRFVAKVERELRNGDRDARRDPSPPLFLDMVDRSALDPANVDEVNATVDGILAKLSWVQRERIRLYLAALASSDDRAVAKAVAAHGAGVNARTIERDLECLENRLRECFRV